MQKELELPKLCEDRGRFYVWLDRCTRHYFKVKGKTKAEREAAAEKAYEQFRAELDGNSPTVPKIEYSPPQNDGTRDTLVAELCSAFLKERKGKISTKQWDNESRVIAVIVSLFGDMC